MRDSTVALSLAIATVAIAIVFVAYALSGADLCIWCYVVGK